MEAIEFVPGTTLIARERERQISDECYSSGHDAQHTGGEIADAAACYAVVAAGLVGGANVNDLREMVLDNFDSMVVWPWDDEDFKPTQDVIRTLVKAGALIAAEIDRLQRMVDPSHRTEG